MPLDALLVTAGWLVARYACRESAAIRAAFSASWVAGAGDIALAMAGRARQVPAPLDRLALGALASRLLTFLGQATLIAPAARFLRTVGALALAQTGYARARAECRAIDARADGRGPAAQADARRARCLVWRRSHRWAAGHCGPCLAGLPSTPPLGPVLDLLDVVSVSCAPKVASASLPAPGPRRHPRRGAATPVDVNSLVAEHFYRGPRPELWVPPDTARAGRVQAEALAFLRARKCGDDVDAPVAPVPAPVDGIPALFGAGDHHAPVDASGPGLTSLAVRAIYLSACFVPFFVAGLPLLLVARALGGGAGATTDDEMLEPVVVPDESLIVTPTDVPVAAPVVASVASATAPRPTTRGVLTLPPASPLKRARGARPSRGPSRWPPGGAEGWDDDDDNATDNDRADDDDGFDAGAIEHGPPPSPSMPPPPPPPSPARAPAAIRTLAARLEDGGWALLLRAIRGGGAAFIKWGQWSSARPDLFPAPFCRTLSRLHDDAPRHSWTATRRAVEEDLLRSAETGLKLEDVFSAFDRHPVASGSVAQVHRATLRASPGTGWREGVEVAVKVRHPGVAERLGLDFRLLRPAAAATASVRALKGLSLKDSVAQFSETMTAQADLRTEAVHLARARAGFQPEGLAGRAGHAGPGRLDAAPHGVVVPATYEGLCCASVLVESFEPGRGVSTFMTGGKLAGAHSATAKAEKADEAAADAELPTHVVALGVDAYLRMLLLDNFVHTDLHPGNILCRRRDAGGDGRPGPVEIVLLDYGLAEALSPRVRQHFIGFLMAIGSGDGRAAADHLLAWAPTGSANEPCRDVAGLRRDLDLLFRRACGLSTQHERERLAAARASGAILDDPTQSRGVDLDVVLQSTLALCRVHGLAVSSQYAALVVGVCVIVGFATALDPGVNLMDASVPCLLAYAITGRVLGGLYS